MIRGIIQWVVEGVIKRFSASGRPGETISDREYFQHYGFSSRPKPGAEAIIIREGNHFIMIASDDRRYRIGLEEGEVCLYTDEGDKVHFKRGKEILVHSGGKITVEAASVIEINAPQVTVNASVKATVNAIAAELNASATAKIVSPSVLMGAASGNKTLMTEDMLSFFNTHTHGEGGAPNQVAGSSLCTAATKAT